MTASWKHLFDEFSRYNDQYNEQQKALAAAGLSGVLPSDGIITLTKERDEARAEIERLRTTQHERAIAELRFLARFFDGAESIDGYRCSSFRDDMKRIPQTFAVDMVVNRLEALRAEQAAAPAPVTPPFPQGSWREDLGVSGNIGTGTVPPPVTPSITPSPMDTASTAVRWDAYEQAKKDVDAWPEWKRKAAGAAFRTPAPATPPADAPNDPTKNVCAIRRRSDGYWWECNSEHGAGWNDKRIRQAWTHRAAHAEVARMKASGIRDDVEVVELAPKPEPDAPQRPSVEELRKARSGLPEISSLDYYDANDLDRIMMTLRLLLDDALAARGGK